MAPAPFGSASRSLIFMPARHILNLTGLNPFIFQDYMVVERGLFRRRNVGARKTLQLYWLLRSRRERAGRRVSSGTLGFCFLCSHIAGFSPAGSGPCEVRFYLLYKKSGLVM